MSWESPGKLWKVHVHLSSMALWHSMALYGVIRRAWGDTQTSYCSYHRLSSLHKNVNISGFKRSFSQTYKAESTQERNLSRQSKSIASRMYHGHFMVISWSFHGPHVLQDQVKARLNPCHEALCRFLCCTSWRVDTSWQVDTLSNSLHSIDVLKPKC